MMRGLLDIIGILVVFAGLDLLWQSRADIILWLETYFRIFRASLHHPDSPERSIALQNTPRPRQHTLRMLLGMGLVFVLGPALIVLGLAL